MTQQNTIYFVTSNQKKFSSLKKVLSSINVSLKQLEYDFDEGRDLTIESVAQTKLNQAKKAFPDKQLIVDDRGFFIPALNGFPGPFVKLLLNSFSYKGLIKLMDGESDRRAIFSYAVGYYSGESDIILTADEVGFITDKPMGNDLHGWTELLYVYGQQTFPRRSLADLSDDEWGKYLEATKDIDPFILLRDHLSTNRSSK